MFSPAAQATHSGCRVCLHPGSDVRILVCGCEVHARCLPLTLIVSEAALRNNETAAVAPGTVLCPGCRASSVSGVYLFPLSTADLDTAVSKRKEVLQAKEERAVANSGGAKSIDMEYIETQAETSYMLLSHNQGSGTVASDHEYQRTGRWTDEETAYVDFLVEAFDSGRIPVEHGLKLNEFLADVLLSKTSRLTKKMKNARLSVRSYNFISPAPRLDAELLSSLEQKFLNSISSEVSRLELKFNLSRLWRSHLSNLCLQVGSSLLHANDWIASLEDIERRAADAEERLRKARRRRMGLALRTDTRNEQTGVFFGGIPVQRPPKKAKIDGPSPVTSSDEQAGLPRVRSVTDASQSSTQSQGSSDSDGDNDFISNMLDVGNQHVISGADDYSKILDDLASGQPMGVPKLLRKSSGPFLEELAHYMECSELPFEHVDVWVPSYRPNKENGTSELRLFHAGFCTPSNTDPSIAYQLDEYGEYSTRFSFTSGVGMPGRVFETGKPVWERNLDQADPHFFERAGGAKVYGVKTGFGFPLRTSVIGVIVVSMYSVNDIPEDQTIVQKCTSDLSTLCPEPKWQLVVGLGERNKPFTASSTPAIQHPGDLLHFQHGTKNLQSDTSQITGENHKTGDVERQIATMLGEYMPLMDIPATGETTNSAAAPGSLVPHFMSLRLLLLRASDRRSDEEREMVEVIKKSYEGYSSDSRRGKRDVALLLVRDWQFLKTSVETGNLKPVAPPPPQLQEKQHQSHVLEIPKQPTYASSGAPVMMPKALPFVNPSAVRRSSIDRSSRGRVESDASSVAVGLDIMENS